MPAPRKLAFLLGWIASAGLAIAVRAWNAIFGPLFYGYDAWGHIAYVFFLDMYRAIPYADQGWSYFHPPLHYLLGWALMQSGSAEVLVIGLSLIGGAASLGVAVLAAWVLRRSFPEGPGYALLGFTAVAFLPVHLYTSPMPGNEMTAAFFAALAFSAHLRNELRETPTLPGDVVTGVLAGLAMLTKFTDLVAVLAIGALTGLLWLRAGRTRASLLRLTKRAAAIAIPLLLLAGPYYARNFSEFGTPFMTSAAVHEVRRIQASQPPGERSLVDFFRFSPEVFEESVPSAPHMIRSIWPNTYLNIWFDTFRESQLPFPRDITPYPQNHMLTIRFGLLGLLPTLIALYGAGVSARRVLAEPRNVIDAGMWILAGGTLSAFVLFSLLIPTWAALKASYLLNLSLPFAFFLARGTQGLWRRGRWLGAVTPAVLGAIALAGSYVFAAGHPPGMLPRAKDSLPMLSVRAHFGDYAPTRKRFRPNARRRSYLEARAAVELFDGKPRLASRFYDHAGQRQTDDPSQRPYWLNRLAVANALDDQPERARMLLDQGLAAGPFVELLVNRAALRAREGDWNGAEDDLRAAIAIAPALPPAWASLAVVLAHQSRDAEARAARDRYEEIADQPPRGFPYGVGNGFLYDFGAGQRFMLMLGPKGDLSLYRPPRARNHADRSS